MQRSICRMVGACGLIFTFTAAAQNAGSGGTAVGTSGGTIAAGASSGGAAAVSGTSGTPGTAPARAGTATARQGQNVSAIPGQSVSVSQQTFGANGQPVQGQAPATSPAGQTSATTAGINSGTTATTAGGTIGTTGTAGAAVGTRTAVSLNSLPTTVQSQIMAQVPAGAQLGNIIAEQTAQGTAYRAQVMQNGIISELALNGVGASALAPGVTATTTGFAAATPSGTLPAASGGFVVGTAYPFEALPVGVQTAFVAQGAMGVTNATFIPAGLGGVFRTMVDGRPVEVRVGPNGQVLPMINRAVAANASNISTNTLRFDDLPKAVRDAIRSSSPYGEVSSIRRSESPSGDLYDVTLRERDSVSTMRLSENGAIVNPRRDLAAALSETTTVLTNEPPKLAWNSLPVAVRDAISVYAQSETIRSLILTNHLGKTTFAVDYTDKDAIRNRLYVGKDGLIIDTQTNLFGITTTGKPVVLDDLPVAARAVVEEQAEKSAVTRIDLAMQGLTPVYVVSYRRDGEARQMVVSRDGRRVDSAIGAPAVSSIGTENATRVFEQSRQRDNSTDKE